MHITVIALAAVAIVATAADADDRVVPAHEEPRHVTKLENEWIRFIDVEIPEGEQTMYHAHSLDYPYLMISDVTLRNQVYGQQPVEVKVERGAIGYYRASTQGTYTHRFINRGPGTFRAIGIELLKPMQPLTEVQAPLPAETGFVTALDNERVRAYRLKLEPGESVGPVTIHGPSIRVAMTGGRISEKTEGPYDAIFDLAPAQFVFRPDSTVTTITNTGNVTIELVEFILK
jgi:hypothetical protein